MKKWCAFFEEPGDHSKCTDEKCLPLWEANEMRTKELDQEIKNRRNTRRTRPDWQSKTPPRGADVELPEVLKILPKKPPRKIT